MITVRGLTKRYGDVLAVDDLTFDVEPGTVTGFLGPNGAGKSTTMRMVLGLDRPSAGQALVLGRRVTDFPEPLREVGALLDPGAVHPGRSGRNHLRVIARTNGVAAGRVEAVSAAAAAVIMVGIAVVAGRSAAGQPDPPTGDPAWAVAEVVLLPAQFALLAIALMAVTSDYATGGIVSTLQATPRRGVLFLARTLVAAATATGLGVLLAVAASLGGWAAARPLRTMPADRGVDVLTTVAFVLASGTLLAVGLGFVLRSTAGVLVTVFLLMLVLPGLLPQLGYDWLTDVADLLPGTGAIFLLTEEPRGRGLTDTTAGATLLTWAGVALLLGWVRLSRDDATR